MDRRLKARSKTPHTPSPVRPQGPKTWEEGATVYFSTPALASQCSQALLREPGSRCSTLKSTRGPVWLRKTWSMLNRTAYFLWARREPFGNDYSCPDP